MKTITFNPLKATDVEVRVAQVTEGKGISLLLYKDARCDMRQLDEAVGNLGWTCTYESIDGILYCAVGIYDEERKEFVWKQDCGVKSNMEEEKGQASDAFKRACFKWGIGRELYTAPFIWVKAADCNITKGRNNKPACYDRFSVKEMTVKEGRITSLTVINDKTGKTVYSMGNPSKSTSKAKTPVETDEVASQAKSNRFAKIAELKQKALDLGIKEEGIKSWLEVTFNGKAMKDFTDAEIKATEAHIQQLINDKQELMSKEQ